MADVLREFLVSLGYKVDPNSEKRFEASVRSATLQADLLGRAIAKSAEKVFEGVQQISKSFEQVYWQAQRTQSTVQGIRAIGYAASQLGSSTESAGASIENFGRQLKWNPGFEGFLKQLGVATRDSKGLRASTDILVDFANKIRSRPKAEQLGLAEVAGIDLATLEAIQSGTFQKRLDEYNAKVKAQGLNSEEAAKRGAEFTQAMKSLGASLEIVGQKLMSEFAGPLQRFVDAFDKWTNDNGKTFVQVIEKIGETLGQLATVVEKVATALKPVWEGFDEFSKKLTGQNGLTTAIEVLIGLKLAGWLLGVASAITSVGTAASGALISGALGRFFGLLGLAAGPAAFALGMTPSAANGGEDAEIARRRANGSWGPGTADELNAGVKPQGQDNSLWGRAKRWWRGGGDPSGGATSAPTGGAAQQAAAQESYEFWRGKGLSHEQAVGMVANERAESRHNPSARGDGGRAHGLYQHHPDRRAAILAGSGIDMSTATAAQQREGAYWEMTKGAERKAWAALKQAETAGEAAAIVSKLYERPLDRDGEAQKRAAMANGLANALRIKQAQGGLDLPPLARINPTALGTAADNAAKVGSGTGAASGATLTPSIAGRGDTTVTINQNNRVEVVGSGDPSLTANQVGDAQRGLGQVLLRDVKGAVR
ncbi:phage tail tip lysozyme [Bosea sp. TAF32]|uniref:phage tail tip lysozyme n=1 Tax=Bosea sp. TAF32 TaxID=3237482 RepID=UPI003F93A6B5